MQEDGNVLEKLILGDYEWMTYKKVNEMAIDFGACLRYHLGQKPKTLITIFAETRAEWIISYFGALTQVTKEAIVFFKPFNIYKKIRQ